MRRRQGRKKRCGEGQGGSQRSGGGGDGGREGRRKRRRRGKEGNCPQVAPRGNWNLASGLELRWVVSGGWVRWRG